MNKIFLTIFGHINLDVVLRVPRIPTIGSVEVIERRVCCGGTAYNMALLAAKLKVPVSVYSVVGRDLSECVENLRRAGVDVNKVIITNEDGPYCYIIDDLSDQIAAMYQGPMNKPDFNVEEYGEWVHFYTGPPEKYLEIASEVSARIVIDPGQEIFYRYSKDVLKKLISIADVLFCNSKEYEHIKMLAGNIDVPVIVVTLGSEGCMLIENNEKKVISSIKVERVVKNVGAGDAFRAGFYRGLYEGKSFEECCRLANEVAARYISGTL